MQENFTPPSALNSGLQTTLLRFSFSFSFFGRLFFLRQDAVMCVFKNVPCMNLGEREMPWEHESRLQYRDAKKKSNLLTLIIKMQIFFACAIITSTARASSVFFFIEF